MLKFILLTTICWNFSDVGTQCTQYLDMDIKNAEKCREEANAIGNSYKQKITELGGSMELYQAQCMAIDEQGYNIDYSFDISYTIS